MSTVDILVVADPKAFPRNSCTVTEPAGVSLKTWKDNVMMIAENEFVVENQGTWALKVKATNGDMIRWWDTPVVQESEFDMIIVAFQKADEKQWNEYLTDPESDTKTTAFANIKDGFGKNCIKYQSSSFPQNFTQATVLDSADISSHGVKITYNFVLAKLNVGRIDEVVVIGYYKIDPVIVLYPK